MNFFKNGTCFLVGTIFFLYGLTKFFHMQKFGIEVTGEITKIPSDELFWYFFGYSHTYLVFLGITECAAGLLMAAPKTYRIGALACAVLGANITLLDFVYNVGPVRYWALFLTLLCCAIIAIEWKAYRKAMHALL